MEEYNNLLHRLRSFKKLTKENHLEVRCIQMRLEQILAEKHENMKQKL